MKKVISLATVFVLCLTALTAFAGCSGSKEVDLKTVLSDINSQYSLSLKELSDVNDLKKYYSIDTEDVKQFAAEINSDSNSRVEIVLVEAVDADAATRVNEALSKTYTSIVTQYSGYNAEKLPMVEACKVTQDGNYVTMIVADQGPEILETFYGYIK
ncbi:DUF4358 domain-containing protein [Ruminococcus sp.]|uniref:DUF4358 domain-containing protein n=1 Tax=Ruminococcus sp. TaxID=41978 RepID=UPI00386D50BC